MEKPVKQIHSAEDQLPARGHVPVQPDTAAFDAAAASYDTDTLTNPVMRWLRRENLRNLRRCYSAGDRLLEIGCGSGAEAVSLARFGATILATDASPRMVGVLSEKLMLPANSNLPTEPRVLPAEQLTTLETEFEHGAFDGAYSSLGPLNCVQTLRHVASSLGYLVRPGGVVAISLLGKYCLWETAWYLAHGRPDLAFRRWRGRARGTAIAGGPLIDVYYWPLKEVEAC